MTGKIPNLEPNVNFIRHKGRYLQYWDSKRQTFIIKSWPKGNGGPTPKRTAYTQRFTNAVKAIKFYDPADLPTAEEITKNTPWLTRDILMMCAVGSLYTITDTDGKVWMGMSHANAQAQTLLDSISNNPGAMLVRTADGWLALLPGTQNQKLIIDPTTGLPEWATSTPDSVPAGGTAGQVLSKISATDYDTTWSNIFEATTAFTPTFTFATPGDLSVVYTFQGAFFKEMDDMVFFNIILGFTPTFTTAAGVARFTGLPRTVNPNISHIVACPLVVQGLTLPAGTVNANFQPRLNTTFGQIVATNITTGIITLTAANFTSGQNVIIETSGFYWK